jgi:hypothetical protein
MSLMAREKVDGFALQVDEYLESFGVLGNEKINGYLALTADEIRKLSDTDLAGITVELSRHAYLVQDRIAAERTKVDICQANLNSIVGHLISEYTEVWGRDDKWAAAIHDNDAAREYKKYLVRCQAIVTRMDGLVTRLDSMIRQLNELLKRRNAGGY